MKRIVLILLTLVMLLGCIPTTYANSNIKIVINNQFETSIKGLYSIGDGGGLTRGLMMASASGVQTARNICK